MVILLKATVYHLDLFYIEDAPFAAGCMAFLLGHLLPLIRARHTAKLQKSATSSVGLPGPPTTYSLRPITDQTILFLHRERVLAKYHLFITDAPAGVVRHAVKAVTSARPSSRYCSIFPGSSPGKRHRRAGSAKGQSLTATAMSAILLPVADEPAWQVAELAREALQPGFADVLVYHTGA